MKTDRRFKYLMKIIRIVTLIMSCAVLKSVFAASSVEKCRQNSSDTKFANNGYEGLVVVVGDDIEQDYSLIEDLRKLITATSEKMFQVTKRRAYIRQVSVLLPRSWGVPPKEFENIMSVKTDTVHTVDRGDFRLRNRSPRSDNEDISWQLGDEEAQVDMPYVIKPTPCGYSGRYLRLTPEFVRFGGKASEMGKMGSPEKILVRQWAKLRWGVYDEIPLDDSESNFYRHTDLEVHPIACSAAITGKIIKSDNPEVPCSKEEALVNKNCTFKPDSTPSKTVTSRKTSFDETVGITGFASLMYSPDLSYVDHFCDTVEESEQEVPEEQQHNAEAPTLHNLHCQGKSVWEVIRTHPDFANGNNPPLPESSIPPPIEFSLLKNPDRRIVLVLDISSSMKFFNRMKLMRQAASQFIDTVPENSWIGIVTFAAEGTVMSELIRVSSNDVRRLLKERLPNFLVPGTSIGSGIKLALQVLKSSGPKHMRKSGGSMLVLSDGKEHNSPKINDTLLEVIDFGVRVTTIAFGAQVADDLDVLAEVTGGSAYFASSGEFSDNSELRDAFLATIDNPEDDMVVVSSQSIRLKANSSEGHTFIIDETIGRETRITVLYTDTVAPKIGLENPWGDVMWEDDDMFDTNITAEFSSDENFSTKTIQYFGYMEPGTWTLLLKNQRLQNSVTADISVFSHPAEEQESLVLSPALLCRIINYSGSESIVIYAHLSYGEFAVLDATVEAVVTRPLSLSGSYDTATVELKDDGRGADVIANDGIYSGYFTRFTLQGRYNVKVNAAGDGDKARLDINHILGLGRRKNDLVKVDTKDVLQNMGNKEENKRKSRKRRSIRGITSRMGKLKAFKRWSTQQKEFIVNDTTAVVCPDGYYHFQDSCYKFVRTPMASFTDASKFCANDGGYLAHVNSNQELLYIMDTIGKKDTWFGGIHQSLNRDDISVEFVTKRIKRGHEDEDLVVLANLFNEIYLNEDTRKIIESFEPDLAGLSRKEINKIIRVLGGTSESDIPLLKEAKLLRLQNVQDMLTTASMRTRTTQHMTTTVSSRNRRQAGTPPSSSGDSSEPSTGVFTTIATSTENATLALAKKYPDQKDYFGSGEQDPECSWFNDGKVVETSGDEVCNRDKAFFCERPKIDLFEPSRITDLKVKVTEDLNIVRLVWTATGDDKTNGRAKEYEIRNLRTKRARKLARNFKDGELLSFAAILNGSVDVAKISGEREELVVNLTEITGCPPHAALDLIILLPRRILSPSSTSRIEKESTLDLFRTLFSIFKISTYEVQVSVVAIQDQLGRVLLRDSTSANEVLNSIRQGLEQDNRLRQEVRYHDTVKILEDMKSRGRSITPKILLSILTEEDMEELITYENTTDMFKIIVGVGIANESDVRAVVSDPPCENAIFASTWKNLNETYREVASQLCYARNDEYQAWGIVAVDEGGLRSEPSNIVSNIIHNHRKLVDCPPEPELPQPSVAGIDVTVVTIAITIPLAAILGIVGAVICFGQVKKYRKKKREKKERKEREAEEAAAEAKRAEAIKNAGIRGNVRANMVGLLQNVRRNSNLKLKINKTAPVTQPPV